MITQTVVYLQENIILEHRKTSLLNFFFKWLKTVIFHTGEPEPFLNFYMSKKKEAVCFWNDKPLNVNVWCGYGNIAVNASLAPSIEIEL